jgi:hypothetical protein
MKKILMSALLFLAGAASAYGADLGASGGSLKDGYDGIPTPATGGFYIDMGLGGSFNKSGKDVSTTTTIPYYDQRTYSNSSVVYDTGVLPNGVTPGSDNIPTTGYIGSDGKYSPSGDAPAGATACTSAAPCYKPTGGFQPAPVTITNTPVTTGYIDDDGGYHAGSVPTEFKGTVCTANKPCADYKATVTHSGVTTATGTVSKTTTTHANYGYSGVLAETRLGYDFRLGNGGWFAGPLASVSYDWAKDSGFQNGFGYKAGARLGYQFPGARLFADAGYAGSHVSGYGFSEDVSGFFVGGGAEIAFSRNGYIFARADWEKDGSFTAADGFKVDESKLTALVGIGFRN